MNVFDAVHHFHLKFGLRVNKFPDLLPPEHYETRAKFMTEELVEWSTAHANHDMPEVLDGLIDLLYVVVGTIDQHGFTPEQATEAFRRVHEANMAKIRVKSADESKRGTTYDVRKPKDWKPPFLNDLCDTGE
jgi:predicted HAD superfamily Cof-like phosphohydrolase